MFKILVADDERFIRKGLSAILNREFGEKILCLEAENGFDALDVIRQERPDLIISDISMPGCDGLEFIRRLKEEEHKIEVIIISGYENFEYAKQAMKLGVKDYIMKPVKKPEFLQLIHDYKDTIKRERQEIKQEVKRSILTNRILEQVKQENLTALLQCQNKEQIKTYVKKLREMGIEFQSSLFVCSVIQYELTEVNGEYIDFAAKNITEEYLGKQEEEYSFLAAVYQPGEMVILFEKMSSQDFYDEITGHLSECVRLIRKFDGVKAFAGVGEITYDLKYLHNSFRQARQAAVFKLYQNEGAAIYDKADWTHTGEQPDPQKLLEGAEKNPASLLNAAEHFLNQPETVRELYEGLKSCIENKLREFECHSVMKEFTNIFTLMALRRELVKGAEHLWQTEESKTVDPNKKIMEDILVFIQQNLTGEIDLNILAEQFRKSPAYISSLFSKSMEVGFNEYVTGQRVEMAKKLLSERVFPIQEVSQMCGYPNAKYFSVVFKKVTGKTPKQYQREC